MSEIDLNTINMNRKFDSPTAELVDAAVLVTGGTGSFGRAFVRRLLENDPPRRLIVFSRDEQKQETMALELQTMGADLFDRLRFFIGDV